MCYTLKANYSTMNDGETADRGEGKKNLGLFDIGLNCTDYSTCKQNVVRRNILCNKFRCMKEYHSIRRVTPPSHPIPHKLCHHQYTGPGLDVTVNKGQTNVSTILPWR